MKKMFLSIAVFATAAFSPAGTGLTNEERTKAEKFLHETAAGVVESVKGLSEAQLQFKPAADKWSIYECVKHIAVSETSLWQMVEATVKQPANPEKRAEIKWSDEDVMKNVEDRSTKRKTYAELEPANTGFKTSEEAISSFTENREKLIAYVKDTQEDLRNHVAAMGPGSFDAYQIILLIGAHSNRHMQQINEVKADPAFPKN